MVIRDCSRLQHQVHEDHSGRGLRLTLVLKSLNREEDMGNSGQFASRDAGLGLGTRYYNQRRLTKSMLDQDGRVRKRALS